MRRPLLAVGVALALAGCAPLPRPPALAADQSIDGRGLLAIEVAYRAAGAALEAAIDVGALHGDAARRADALDAEAAQLVARAREAYDASNAHDYFAAVRAATPLIAELRTLAGR